MNYFRIVSGLSALAFGFAVISCEKLDFIFDPVPEHGHPRGTYPERPVKDSLNTDPGDTGPGTIYVTGVEFPDGYDWRTDSLYGSVRASIVLFRDSTRILSLETGAASQMSADPDMHHLLEGNVYTEYSDGSSTVVKRNGDRLFAYGGREILKGLLVKDENVYSLGQDKSGTGFSFCRDGEVLLRKKKARPLGDFSMPSYDPWGALYSDLGDICFSYFNEEDDSWYISVNGGEQRVDLPSGTTEVYDIRRVAGNIYTVTASGMRSPILAGCGYILNCSDTRYEFEDSFRIVLDSGSPYCMGTGLDRRDGRWKTVTWGWGLDGILSEDPGRWNYYFDARTPGVYVEFDTAGAITVHSPGSADRSIPDMYYFFSYRCASLIDGEIRLALTSREENKPVLWTKDGQYEYGFNGFLTGISKVNSEQPRPECVCQR